MNQNGMQKEWFSIFTVAVWAHVIKIKYDCSEYYIFRTADPFATKFSLNDLRVFVCEKTRLFYRCC